MLATQEQVGVVVVLTPVCDYLDESSGRDLKERVTQALEGASRLVIDLSRVRFVDSSGCGALLSILRQVNIVGGRMVLCAVTEPVRALFDLMRLRRVIDIYETRSEALGVAGAG
jgi:anti-sigma B factor antagonist